MMQPTRLLTLATSSTLAFVAGAALAGAPLFEDYTAQSGIQNTHASSGYSQPNYTAGGAAGDFNNDGWQDVYVIQGHGQDKLFINNGDGTFTDQGVAWGLPTHRGKGATTGDFNNDGWLDVYVTSAGPTTSGAAAGHHKLLRNNGDGTFTNVAASAGVNFSTPSSEDGFCATFGDYDLDGDLDLCVAGFANNNAGTKLFQNNGDETFTDVSANLNLDDVGVDLKGFAPRFIDMNGDRYPELLMSCDFGTRSRYFRNNGNGTFNDLTDAAQAGDDENGMGQTVGDYNNDGLMDWYVTSIYFPSINWTGNKLYINQGNDQFNEVSGAAGVDDGGYGWAALSVDFNHDGWVDIAETNGDSGDFGTTFFEEPSYLWLNNGDGTFTEDAVAQGLIHNDAGRGMINFDMDNDGDQDVIIFTNHGPLSVFRNLLNDTEGAATNWLRLFLDTSASSDIAPNGCGAFVYVTATFNGEPHTILRAMTPGDSFESSSEWTVHFGLADAAVIDEIRVEWPNGLVTTRTNVPVNQSMTISSSLPGDLNGDGVINGSDLAALLAQWNTNGSADITGDGVVNGSDLAALLAMWTT